jgi:hypothetical protein
VSKFNEDRRDNSGTGRYGLSQAQVAHTSFPQCYVSFHLRVIISAGVDLPQVEWNFLAYSFFGRVLDAN